MNLHGIEIHFDGIGEEEFYNRDDSRVSVLSGTNNCGKTLILKQLFIEFKPNVEKAYFCGAQRYFNLQHFPLYSEEPNAFEHSWDKTRTQIVESDFNSDPVVMPFQNIFVSMSDVERDDLYRICTECLGERVVLAFENPNNSMSNSYLKVGDTPFSKCSMGSRMLVHLVAVLVCKQFKIILIDEPELGLTPRIQNMIQRLLFDSETNHFPHLRHIYIATHSHIFLNRRCVNDNFLVKKMGNEVHVRRLDTHKEFQDLHFSQLGNSLEQLQLPSGFLIVEGITDHQYLDRLIHLKFPNTHVNIISANGDGQVKKTVYDLLKVIGNLDTSPYSDRVFVLLDATHSSGLKSDLVEMGLNESSVIEWSENGMEYYYPVSILQEIFKDDSRTISNLEIEEDRVSHNGIQKSKGELCGEVLKRINGTEELKPELEGVLKRIDLLR